VLGRVSAARRRVRARRLPRLTSSIEIPVNASSSGTIPNSSQIERGIQPTYSP
jgi:hypothetical protein